MAAAMLLERVVNLDRVIPHKTSGRAAKVCARPKIASTSCTVAPKRVSDPIRRHILAHERDRGDADGHTFGLPIRCASDASAEGVLKPLIPWRRFCPGIQSHTKVVACRF